MTDLSRVQRLFTSAIDNVTDPVETARLHHLLATGAGLGPDRRVAVYRDCSRRARQRALEAIYPVCRQVLGDRYFVGLTASYITAYPSKSGDLNVYGADFPEHMQAQCRTREASGGLPYIVDLARLEWHWHAVYYAPNDPAFDSAGFAAIAAAGRVEQTRFRLSAALRLLASDYPIGEVWRRHREGSDTSAVAMGNGDRLVILRIGFRPVVESAQPDIFELLSAISCGETLSALAANGLAVEQIPRLIETRWIVGFGVTDEP